METGPTKEICEGKKSLLCYLLFFAIFLVANLILQLKEVSRERFKIFSSQRLMKQCTVCPPYLCPVHTSLSLLSLPLTLSPLSTQTSLHHALLFT